MVGNDVILERNTVKNSEYHYFEMWRDGKRILSTDMEPKHVLSGLQPGFYEVYLQVKNGSDKALANCSFSVEDFVIEDHEHDFSEYTIDKKATLNEWGTAIFHCSECDATVEYEIPEVNAAVLAKYKYTYNGKNNKPSVTVTDVEGNKLVKGTDYSVKYSGNGKSVGRYKVTVTLKGIYSGTKTLYYYVMPKTPTNVKAVFDENDTVTVSWKKSTGAIGYYVYYKESTEDTYLELGATEELIYTQENLEPGVEYNFKIVPYYTANEKLYFSDNAAEISVVLSENE